MAGASFRAVVLCEGKEDKQVVECLLADMGILDVEVREYKGKDFLRKELDLLKASPEFTRGQYSRILVTRDADNQWDSAWDSMRDSINQAFGLQLADVNQWTELNDDTQIAAWIFPGRGQGGMIETLCLDVARQSDPAAFECLDQYALCLEQKHQAKLHEKARFEIWTIAAQTFEAPRRRLSMGRILEKLPFDWKNEEFQETREIMATLSKTNGMIYEKTS